MNHAKHVLFFGLCVFLLTAVSSALPSGAWAVDFCANPVLGEQPLLAEGRVMPLKLHALKIRKNLFTSDSCEAVSASALYCYLSLGRRDFVEQNFSCHLKLKADHIQTFALLGLPGRSSEITPNLALSQQEKLLAAYHALEAKAEHQSGPGNDLSNLLLRLETLQKVESANDWLIRTDSGEWKPAAELMASLDPAGLEGLVFAGLSRISAEELRTMKVETLYERSKPFSVAIVFSLLGFIASMAASRSPLFGKLAATCLGLAVSTEILGIALRVMISGRGPVTNMFETVMWVGLVILILSMILGLKLRNRQIWAAGFAGNIITLFMMMFATRMLDGNIQPLVPVLRDNFWLSTHVTAVTSSYACFAFGWVISNFLLLRRLAGHRSAEMLEKWNYVTRIAMQVGTVFLAAGVILGGVWADYSWGRFWGWDPKETWSLIALIIHMGILHGRYVGWFRGYKFTIASALGFLSIIMAWFGVNFILAVGLHSYGFSTGGAAFIMILTAAQLVVIGATWLHETTLIKT